MTVFDDVSKEKLFLYEHKIEWINKIPVAQKAKPYIVKIEESEPLMEECKQFLYLIEAEKSLLQMEKRGCRC